MEVSSALNAGLQGIQNSQQKIDQSAAEIAGAAVAEPKPADGQANFQSQSSANIAEQLVQLRRHELAYKASAEVVRSADQLLSKFVDDMV